MQTFLSVKFVAGSVLDSISTIWKYFRCQANFCFIILILEGISSLSLLCLNHFFCGGGRGRLGNGSSLCYRKELICQTDIFLMMWKKVILTGLFCFNSLDSRTVCHAKQLCGWSSADVSTVLEIAFGSQQLPQGARRGTRDIVCRQGWQDSWLLFLFILLLNFLTTEDELEMITVGFSNMTYSPK